MSMFSTTRRKVALAAVGLVASLGIGGSAYAATLADSSSPTTSPTTASAAPTPSSPTSAAHAAKRRARGLLARADYATVEVKVKGQWVTYDVDRGKVQAVSATSITLTRPDGQSVTEAINSATKFAGVSSPTAITVGKEATAVSVGGTATRVTQRSATHKTSS